MGRFAWTTESNLITYVLKIREPLPAPARDRGVTTEGSEGWDATGPGYRRRRHETRDAGSL